MVRRDILVSTKPVCDSIGQRRERQKAGIGMRRLNDDHRSARVRMLVVLRGSGNPSKTVAVINFYRRNSAIAGCNSLSRKFPNAPEVLLRAALER